MKPTSLLITLASIAILSTGKGYAQSQQPDVQCATSAAGNYDGANTYSITGAGQTVAINTTNAAPAYCYIRAQNDGVNSARINLKPTSTNLGSFKYTYYNYSDQNVNISNQITSSAGFTTKLLNPGAWVTIKVKVEPLWKSPTTRASNFSLAGHTTNGYTPATSDKYRVNFSIKSKF